MTIEADLAELDQPVTAEHPCGEDLDSTQLLLSFDTYRIFGEQVPLSASVDWREIKTKSFDAIKSKSKDLRILGHFAVAALHTDGWAGYLGSLGVAARWIKQYWTDVYPRVDDDAIMRKNALNSFSDPISVLDGIRRTPIVENRQIGRISLRDVDLASGQQQPTELDTAPADQAQVAAVFSATSTAELSALSARITAGLADLKAIDAAMTEFGGTDASPDFDRLLKMLSRINGLLVEQLTGRVELGAEVQAEGAAVDGTAASGAAVGAIRSRQDALRALDAVALFFKQTEPSSPIPMFLERAKRLVGKDFLEILADIAPDGLATARSVGGLSE
jgi:type VI secretion system protein ImpA